MSVINTQPLAGASGSQVTGYNLTKSLRFRSSASASLNRTPASSSNRKTWTFSTWVKRGSLSSDMLLLSVGSSDSARTLVYLDSANNMSFLNNAAGAGYVGAKTVAVLRDPSAWYHIIYSIDTTQATAANRVKLYINGVQQTTNTVTITQNEDTYINTGGAHYIGRSAAGQSSTDYFDGYLAETILIDGQALTASSFGENDTITGVWKPKVFTGTYGTNGFYLPFTDVATTSGSNAGLGKDFSGNGNYWNTNNISVTSGATYDSMTDVPTLTSATAANYAVMNPLDKVSGTASNGNLTWTASASQSGIRGTVAIPSSGAFYMECTVGITTGAAIGVSFGLAASSVPLDTSSIAPNLYQFYASSGGQITLNNASLVTTLGAFNAGDVLQIAVDATNTKMWLGKNNTWYDGSGGTTGNPSTGANPTTTASMVGLFPFSNCYQENVNWNFGQRAYSYTPPTGFKALNTYNLPDSTIVAGNKVMDATTYTGTGTTLSITNAGAFKPDFLWIKTRQSGSHALIDSVRGVNKVVNSNNTDAENTSTAGTGLTSFNSNGFTLGSNNSGTGTTNYSGDTFVAWQWQAGQGSSASNTSGSITSTVSVNASAGFSIVTYTGTATAATIGHGLGVAPKMIIVKRRDSAGNNIPVYHVSTGAANVPYLENQTGYFTRSGNFNDTAPTSTVFSVGGTGQSDYTNTNASGGTYVAYCWAEIAGFSKFSSYTGNGSSDGPFVYTGFKPKYILIKNTGSISGYGDWYVWDSVRNTYNIAGSTLRPNTPDIEYTNNTAYALDVVSNGFKVRNSYNDFNASGYTYIYAAFAENPFKNSLAR